MRKVTFTTTRRPTKDDPGRQEVGISWFDGDGKETFSVSTGYILREKGVQSFRAYLLDGTHLDNFGTRQQAGEALKRSWDKETGYVARQKKAETDAPATEAAPEGSLPALVDASTLVDLVGATAYSFVLGAARPADANVDGDLNFPGDPAAEETEETEAEVEHQERLLTLEEAAKELCGDAQNPTNALRKRIARGRVETRNVDGETMVVASAE